MDSGLNIQMSVAQSLAQIAASLKTLALGYVPYTGATAPLNLGSQTLTTTGAVSTGALTVTSPGLGIGVKGAGSGVYIEDGANNIVLYMSSVSGWTSSGSNVIGAIASAQSINFYTNYSTTPMMTLATTGVVTMPHYGAGAATFDASGNISSVSDDRLKIIKGKYKSGLKELRGVVPILHKWNKKSGMETKGTYAGFSAQNVKKNIPHGTGKNKEGYLSLQDRAILATLVNSVNEISKRIELLETT